MLRFKSTKSETNYISLDKHLEHMSENQESIYYMSGDSIETMKKTPALQIFKKKDLEVLMVDDHLDEPCIQIQKADVKLVETDEEKEKFPNLKDIKRASHETQAFQNREQIGMMAGRKTLRINPNHPVVIDLLRE